MQVRYLKTVDSPAHKAGKKGEVRDLQRSIVLELITEGYVEDVKNPAQKAEPEVVNKLVTEKTE